MKKIKISLARGTIFTVPIKDECIAYQIVEDWHKGRFTTLTIDNGEYENYFEDITDIRIIENLTIRQDISE